MSSTARLVFEDAPTPELTGIARYGTITHLYDAPLLGRKVARVVLSTPVTLASRAVSIITVVPRHRGCGFGMAAFLPIAVYVTDLADEPGAAGREEGAYLSRAFAIATVRRLWWRPARARACPAMWIVALMGVYCFFHGPG